jgi:hypothetical protein
MKEKEELLKELEDKKVMIDNLHNYINDRSIKHIHFYENYNRLVDKCNTYIVLFYITFILFIISILMLIFI